MINPHVIRVHSWFETTGFQGSFTPHPQPLSPSRGEGCQVGDLGLESPSYMECSSSMPKRPSHSCPFVSIRGLKPPPHACSFVVQNNPLIRVHSWFETTGFHGTFTPHPRPLSPCRGEGCQVVISGWKARATWNATHPCPTPISFVSIRVHSCSFVVQNHPLIHCSFVVQNHRIPGGLHPSPPAPLPFQGRGVPGRELGLESPSYMECSSSMPKRQSHSCPFVFIRGSKLKTQN